MESSAYLTLLGLSNKESAYWNRAQRILTPADRSRPEVLKLRLKPGDHGLMLFGGAGHKTYLGCVNCSEYASDSVFNEYGVHGSKYPVDSVLNPYGQFGSQYSSYGACSPYATDPPVIVDGSGQFYGRLTMNVYHAQRTRDSRLLAWLAAVCAD